MLDTINENNITEMVRLLVFCCPYCKIRIPFIKLQPMNGQMNIVIKCECISFNEKTMSIDSFLSSFNEISHGSCKSHNKKGERYCFYCMNWLCQECCHVHNLLMLEHKESIFGFELRIICEKHKKKFEAFCQNDNIELCEDCLKSNEHKKHSIFIFNESIDTLNQELLSSIDVVINDNKLLLEQILHRLNQGKDDNTIKSDKILEFKNRIMNAYIINVNIYEKLKEVLKAIISLRILIKPFINLNLDYLSTIWIVDKQSLKIQNDEEIGKACVMLEAYFLNYFALKQMSKYECLNTIENEEAIYCMIKLSDEHIVSGSKDSNIILWVYDNKNKSYNSLNVFRGHENWVLSLCLLDELSFASGSHDTSIRVWNITNPNSSSVLNGHKNSVTCLTQITNNNLNTLLISGSRDTTIRIWNIKTLTCIEIITNNTVSVRSLKSVDNTSFYAGTIESTLTLYLINGTKNEATIFKIENKVSILCFESVTLNVLVAGLSNSSIILIEKLKLIGTFTGHTDSVLCLAKLNNAYFLSGSRDKTIRVWCIKTYNCFLTLMAHNYFVSSLVTINSNIFASCSYDKSIKIWKLNQLLHFQYI